MTDAHRHSPFEDAQRIALGVTMAAFGMHVLDAYGLYDRPDHRHRGACRPRHRPAFSCGLLQRHPAIPWPCMAPHERTLCAENTRPDGGAGGADFRCD